MYGVLVKCVMYRFVPIGWEVNDSIVIIYAMVWMNLNCEGITVEKLFIIVDNIRSGSEEAVSGVR